LKKIKNHYKRIIAWITVLVVAAIVYVLNPWIFSVDNIVSFVGDNKYWAMFIYFLILSVLGIFVVIPSTPFAIAGVIIFSPVEALVLNLLGILTSTTIVYYFARYLGIGEVFEEKYPGKIKKLKKALQHKEMPIIISWSFFPAVPTDVITYVASGMRIPIYKCLTGVFIGEGLLNTIYILSAGAIINL